MEVERTGKLQLKLEFMPFIPPMVLSIPEQPSPPLLPRAVHRTLPQLLLASPGDMENAHRYPPERLYTSGLFNTPGRKHPE